MSSFIDALNWRYATKKFDPTKKLSAEQVDMLLEAARLTPSSFGLQPWKFIHVKDAAVREQLKAASYGQPQLTDASDLIVFAVNKNVDVAYVDNYVAAVAKDAGVEVSSLEAMAGMIKGTVSRLTPEQAVVWSTHQVYIALGVVMAAAAVAEIDSCPMEGFDVAKFDEILGLEAKGLHAAVILPVGFRMADDRGANGKKSRFSKEELVIEV